MNSSQLKHAIGILSGRQATTLAIEELRAAGFPMHKLSVIAKNAEANESLNQANAAQQTMTPAEGAKAGVITGGAAGGLLTLIAGLTALAIPGFGPVLAIESALAALLTSGAGATVGGLVGALQGWFVPEDQARLYDEWVSRGEYLVTVEGTADEIQKAELILRRSGIREWHVYESPEQADGRY